MTGKKASQPTNETKQSRFVNSSRVKHRNIHRSRHSRASGNPETCVITLGIALDSRFRGNDADRDFLYVCQGFGITSNPGLYPMKDKLSLAMDKLSSNRDKMTITKDKRTSARDKRTLNRVKLTFIKDKVALVRGNLLLVNDKLSFVTDSPMNGVQQSA